jgi:hypothetical protein
MTSPARANAARANGAKSRGPVTSQGKANSVRNNRRHGMRAAVVFPDHTTQPSFTTLLAAFNADLLPASERETCLVYSLALADWRTMRLWEMETDIMNREIRRLALLDPDSPAWPTLAARAFSNVADRTCALDLIIRCEGRLERQFYRALDRLQAIRNASTIGLARILNMNVRTQQLIENKQNQNQARLEPTRSAAAAPQPSPIIQTEDQRHTPSARQHSVDHLPAVS